jgi:transcriptional regulator with XRE-family HTH domain
MADIKTAVERNVRAEMARQLESQADVARVIGLSPTAMGARLRGQTPFKADEVKALAAHFGVTISYLYGEALPK